MAALFLPSSEYWLYLGLGATGRNCSRNRRLPTTTEKDHDREPLRAGSERLVPWPRGLGRTATQPLVWCRDFDSSSDKTLSLHRARGDSEEEVWVNDNLTKDTLGEGHQIGEHDSKPGLGQDQLIQPRDP